MPQVTKCHFCHKMFPTAKVFDRRPRKIYCQEKCRYYASQLSWLSNKRAILRKDNR